MDDALGTRNGAADGIVVREGAAEVRRAVDSCRTALERCHGMALADQQPGDFPAEQPACAGYEDPHGSPGRPPASTLEAQRDRRVLSILALCRISVGCAGTVSTAE